jgi:uncharacterized membrane protein
LKLQPSSVFAILSLGFGSLIIVVTPPLRGPDETSHFLRAYGISQGELIPSLRLGEGRKGIVLPAKLYEGFAFFENVRTREKEPGFSYRAVVASYLASSAADPPPAPTYVPYAGSEGYSPFAYLPHVAAAAVARVLDLTFLPTLYLMRFAGLLVLTGIITRAIAAVPQIAWALVAIGMLPASVYGRSVVSADGCAFAAAVVVTTLWLRGMIYPQRAKLGWQSVAMIVNALTKPPNVAFVLLELRLPKERRALARVLLVMLPAIAAAFLWTLGGGADTATWRMVEITGQDSSAFDPALKLSRMIDHPWHFPSSALSSLDAKSVAELWRQTIGVLGLFDTVLRWWVYPAVSILVLGTFLVRSSVEMPGRRHIFASASLTVAAYIFTVYLISYLVFTPSSANSVWGVQGRYFVPVLPLVAIAFGALGATGFGKSTGAALAVTSSVLSGVAVVEAVIATDWPPG